MEDSQDRKLFVGGISQTTNEESLRQHFIKYGEVQECEVLRDRNTGCSRGFAFILFSDSSSSLKALQDDHVILGIRVEVTVARPKSTRPQVSCCSNEGNGNSSMDGSSHSYDKKKIFVGGLPSSLTKDELNDYFKSFGTITDVVVIFDKESNRARGFGFVTFDSEDVVEKVLSESTHLLNDKVVDVKKAIVRPVANANRRGCLSGMGSFAVRDGDGYSWCPNGNWSGYEVSNGCYYGEDFARMEGSNPFYNWHGSVSFRNYYYPYFQPTPYPYWSPPTTWDTRSQVCPRSDRIQKNPVPFSRIKISSPPKSKEELNENGADQSSKVDDGDCRDCAHEEIKTEITELSKKAATLVLEDDGVELITQHD